MNRTFLVAMIALTSSAGSTAALAQSYGLNLQLRVPVHCSVRHQASGLGAPEGDAVALGSLREYCNAPGGYRLLVSYTPGTLRGTVLAAGEDRIVLDGSGSAVVSTAPGPRVRTRAIAAKAGERGFDSARLDFSIQAI